MRKTRIVPYLVTAASAAVFALFSVSQASAQQTGAISGQVSRADGSALGGAQVSLPELQIGTITGDNGRFRIEDVPAGTHRIEAQVIGFGSLSKEVTVIAGQVAEVSFTLQESAIELETVVATALGISREERSLGYSMDEIEGEEISEIPTDNFSTALAGKAAGLQVKDLGNIGGSTSVTLRGFNSISSTNQALFVVDGIPMNNESNVECNRCSAGWDGSGVSSGISNVDYGNGVQDLNPEDIESVSILKGANAAALYGSRASNGVVLVETKKGKGTDGVRFTGSFSNIWNTPLQMKTVQNEYGGGQTPTDYNWVNGAGAGFNDATDESWGPPLDGTEYPQWFSESAPFLASPYSPRKFYETGRSTQANVSISAAGESQHLRASGTLYDGKGNVPTSQLDRTSLNLAGGIDLAEDITLTGTGNYVQTGGDNRPNMVGYPHGMGVVFSYWQRQVDTNKLWDAYQQWKETGEYPRDGHPQGRIPNWNHNFFDSPYYSTHERDTEDTRDRLIGSLQLDYNLTSWLDAMARVGTDLSSHRMYERYPDGALAHRFGEYRNNDIVRQETNSTAMLTSDLDLTTDLRLTSRVGGAIRREKAANDIAIARRLNVPGTYNVTNSASPPILNERFSEKHVNSLYGLATLSYRDWAYIDATGRNDWSSTLPEGENSYFYPSLSASAILSDAVQLPQFLSYAKVRASWARTGSDAEPYQLRRIFEQGPFWQGTPSYTNPDQLPARELRPEEATSIEFGAEARFADDRGSLDLTYYKTNTRQQILPVDISPTSGFSESVMNAGEVVNKGVEATLGYEVLSGQDPDEFSWEMNTNFATHESEVRNLPEGVESIVLTTTRGLTVEAREGEEYGAMLGQVTKTNDQGQELVDENGNLLAAESKQVLGHFQPDWTAGLRNTIEYQGLRLSTLLDLRVGGEIFCQTCALGRRTGQLIETLKGRDEFELAHDAVQEDGTPNEVKLPLPNYRRQRYRMFHYYTYDATYAKLRELTMGFNLPQGLVNALPLSEARLSIVGRNLMMLHKNVPHIDPELTTSSGNAQGVEVFRTPTSRSLGIRLNVR